MAKPPGVAAPAPVAREEDHSDDREQVDQRTVWALGAISGCVLASMFMAGQTAVGAARKRRICAERLTIIIFFYIIFPTKYVLPLQPLLAARVSRGDSRRAVGLITRIGVYRSALELLLLPVCGRLSDRYGRVPVLQGCCAAMAVSHGWVALSPSSLSLLASQVVQGAVGIGGVLESCVLSAVSDSNDGGAPALAARTAAVRTLMAVGMIVGPVVAGAAAKAGLQRPFAAAAATAALGGGCCALWLPETQGSARRAAAARRQASEGGTWSARHCLNPVSCAELFRRSARLRWLTVMCALSMAAEYTHDVRVLFYVDRLRWTAGQIGLYTSLAGVTAIVSSALTQPALGALGGAAVTMVGSAGCVFQNWVTAAASGSAAMYSSLLGLLFGGVTMRLSSTMALQNLAGRDDGLGAGEVAAMRSNLNSILRLVVPFLFSRMYRDSISSPFAAAGALAAAAAAMAAG